jgi:glycosyltransferase involved in cell wall biosynthesis
MISAVIPVRDKAGLLERCIGSVVRAAAQHRGTEVIVVENGSSDGSDRLVDDLFATEARVLHTAATTIATARNQGARLARGEILCFLDADVVVPPDFFVRVERTFQAPVGAAGCTVALADDGWISRTWERLHYRGVAQVTALVNSADFAVRREAFWAVDGFEESLITGEDADLCLRLTEAGHTLVELPELQVLHLDNPRSLMGFTRKEVWHGLGALATLRTGRLDKPFAMTLAHAVMLVCGAAVLMARGFDLTGWVLAMTAAFSMPLLAVQYRRTLARHRAALLPSVLLYQIYLLSRIWALLLALTRRGPERTRRAAQKLPVA